MSTLSSRAGARAPLDPTAEIRHGVIARLAAPLVLATVSTPVLGLVDTAVVGHLPEAHHLGAVALGTMIFNYVLWAFAFLRMSTTGLAAQALGAGDVDAVRATLGRAVALALGIGVLVIGLTLPLARAALGWLSASAEVRSLAQTYVSVRVWSAPATFTNYVLFGWLLGLQRTRAALILELARVTVYGALDAGFVLGLGWGVTGVAAAAASADVVVALVGAAVVARILRRTGGSWRWAMLRDARAFKVLFGMNVDLFVRTQCLLVAFAGFTAQGARLGDDVLAANSVLMNLYFLVAYAVSAFGHVGSALSGSALGRGRWTELRAAVRMTTTWAAGAALVGTVLLVLGGGPAIEALTGVAAVRGIARAYLPYAALLPLVSVLALQFDGIAVGISRSDLLRNTLLAAAAVYVAAALTLVDWLGNHGLWLSFTLFMGARSGGFIAAQRVLRRGI